MKIKMPKRIKQQAVKVLSQCLKCNAVEVELADGRMGWQGSIVVFTNKPKKLCFKHR